MARKFVEPEALAPIQTFVKELRERAKVVQRMVTYQACRFTLDTLQTRLPSEVRELKRGLQIGRVEGLADDQAAFVVHAVVQGQATKPAEEESTVLYVSGKQNLMRPVPRSVRILEAHNPWTIDTLPYQPDAKTSVVISRRVNPRVVMNIRKQRQRERPVWRRKMLLEGLREVRKDLRIQQNRTLKAIPDVAYDSLRLELGLGGKQAKPHWRPAILRLASGGLTGMIRSNREISRTMTDPSYQGWQGWSPSGVGSVTTPQASKYVPFQNVLGIRLGGAS